ncbi:MAG TPA: phospholipase D-like domain-containing protein [Gemmatimonadales bacterium]|nr:phospholipase D-like domain-containing protein [Gemmatimonadales bacterium]
MTEALGLALPWWGWAFLVFGVISVVGVMGALFFPDWPTPDYVLGFEADPTSDLFVHSSANFLNAPVLRGGRAEILQNGDRFYPAMLEAIAGAKDTINFEVYIFDSDDTGRRFIEALTERARAGVEVRLLLDWFGSLKLKRADCRELRNAGVKLEFFRPLALRNLVRMYRRTHRRAIVIDGVVAFTGGAAVSNKWRGDTRSPKEWRDSMTRVTGALVTGVQSAFAANWVYCCGEVIAGPRFYPPNEDTGPACGLSVVSSPSDAQQPIRLLFWLSFINAQRRLWITSSYFIPDRHLRKVVQARARDGVDVRILVPGNHTDAIPVQYAGRGYYEELLEAGVRIFEYQPSMMHAKTVVVDDGWTLVGSANMDERSMEINEENLLGIAESGFARAVVEGIERDLARSKEIRLDAWRRRPVYQRVLEKAAKVLIEQY